MSRRSLRFVVIALLLASCSGSGSGSEGLSSTKDEAEISESLLAALSMVPDVDGETIWFDGTNYERAFELTGLAVPDPDDTAAVEQLIEATIDLPTQASAFMSVAVDPREMTSEIGFSFAETRLTIATSGSIDTLETVFVTDVEDWEGRAVDPSTTLLDGPVAVIASGRADPAVFLPSVTSAKADGTSLADNADVVDSLAILEAYDAYRFTYGNRASEPFDPSVVVPALALAPYNSIATGVSLDDGAHLNILVLGHHDDVTAQANAELLRSVLEDGQSVYREAPWSDFFAVRSIEVIGSNTVAVLEPLASPTALDEVSVSGDSLLWFTTD